MFLKETGLFAKLFDIFLHPFFVSVTGWGWNLFCFIITLLPVRFAVMTVYLFTHVVHDPVFPKARPIL